MPVVSVRGKLRGQALRNSELVVDGVSIISLPDRPIPNSEVPDPRVAAYLACRLQSRPRRMFARDPAHVTHEPVGFRPPGSSVLSRRTE